MEILAYIAVKFLLYFLVAYWAVPMLGIKEERVIRFGLLWGTVRIVVGFVSIFAIGILGMPSALMGFADGPAASFINYLVIFSIVRCFSWYVVFQLFAYKYGLVFNKRTAFWILIGVLSSFAVDYVAVMLGLDNLKFVC
ncbi:MAG: hypothetical protein COB41_08755 [Proteobacteria bacterium]|nr:MAG: hypothetical protein COB41_08755 [Pseudomonadota bacterium]